MSYAVGFVVAGSLTWFAHDSMTTGEGWGVGNAAGVIAVVGSVVLAILASRRLIHPRTARRVSPFFLVFGALLIHTAELWHTEITGGVWLGISWACLWIVVYPFVGPSFIRQSVVPALLAATTGPVMLATAVEVGLRPLPEPGAIALLFVPTFLAVGLSVFPAKAILKIREYDRLGSYSLIERLGRGGMGEVWRAEHRMLARPAAIKLILNAEDRGDRERRAEAIRRFRAEAQATSDSAVAVSGALKTVAISLSKIANDLRWLGSGPRAGLGELKLPPVQPGSSIMPGKVNPVICEALIQTCAQVIGNDAAITQGGLGGVFELNLMLPLVARNLLESIEILAGASTMFREKLVEQLEADEEQCADYIEGSLAMGTALVPVIGSDAAAALANEAHATGGTWR